jgi:predicted MFS family arabinose efflux permease
VQGLTIAISYLAIPLGRGITGLLVEPVGLAAIFASIAATFLLLCLIAALHPAFRDMRAPSPAGDLAYLPQRAA